MNTNLRQPACNARELQKLGLTKLCMIWSCPGPKHKQPKCATKNWGTKSTHKNSNYMFVFTVPDFRSPTHQDCY
jgi:hypothetical protein